jgi:integrase/recombinase XerC
MTTATSTSSSAAATFEGSLAAFLRALAGENKSAATIAAYRTDVQQFVTYLAENNLTIKTPADVRKADLSEYLAHLGGRGLSGVTRARKLAALREYFRFLVEHELIDKSPAAGLETPKKERNGRTYLRPEEYTKILSLAGANPRDNAIFQVFLQTGVRVSELCALAREDIDLPGGLLHVREGKGQASRDIPLEKKAIQALKSYLRVRGESPYEQLFLNYQGEPLGERGVRKLVTKYCQAAGLTKKASPHAFRHSFATLKAEKNVSPYQLQEWLGHRNLNTTQIYVHLGKRNSKKLMEATSL